MKGSVSILLCLTLVSQTAGESVGSIATINTFDGEHFGPYIVKDFHSDAGPEAAALVVDEGSGDGPPYLDTDTESGDDDPSGKLPAGNDDTANDISLHAAPVVDHDASEATPQVTTPTTTTKKPITAPPPPPTTTTKKPITAPPPPPTTTPSTTTKRVTTVKETTRPPTTTTTTTTTTTKAPTPARSTSKAPPVPTPTQSAVTAENSSCHSSCQKMLYRTSLTAMPNKELVRESEKMGFKCEVSIGKEDTAFAQELSLHWVYEGGNPPQSECALIEEEYLALCEGFTATELKKNNATSLSSYLIVSDLSTHNSGYFKCQVRVNCCSSTLQHELSRSLTVWTADYTVPIAILSAITAAMLLILVAGIFVQRRNARPISYKAVPNTITKADEKKAESKKMESHLPFVVYIENDDCDSFSSTDDY